MITRIQAHRYRSLREVDMSIGPFEVLVGPNGSGKSTFLDVIGILGDILRVGPLKAILGDQRLGVVQRAPDPSHLVWMREGDRLELAIEATIPQDQRSRFTKESFHTSRYEVAVGVGGQGEPVSLLTETLWLLPETDAGARSTSPSSILQATRTKAPDGWRRVVTKDSESGIDHFFAETSDWENQFKLGPAKSALADLPEDEDRFPVAAWFKRLLLDGVQRIVLSSEAIRRPSPPGPPKALFPDGSNLPWIVHALSDEARSQWVTHLQTALPDIQDITTIERPEDRHRYIQLVYTGGLRAPSWLVSDGALRLLALTLLAYVPGLSGIYLIEEPENAIHPKAVQTVFEALSQVHDAQILCATHSPVLVSLAGLRRLLCFSCDEKNGTSVIRGSDHPRLKAWKGEVDLGTYFASGVLECWSECREATMANRSFLESVNHD